LVIAAMVAVLAAGAAVLVSRDDPEVTFCTMEGMIGTDGEIFGRSTSHGCQFVDDSGDLITSLPKWRGALLRPRDADRALRPTWRTSPGLGAVGVSAWAATDAGGHELVVNAGDVETVSAFR
jgi:hypothetical protein